VINRYSDHAANERTFLAWVRTGIATIAFGFVIEKFNLFVIAMEKANQVAPREHRLLGKMSGMLGEYDGSVLIGIGIVLIALSAFRFIRTARLIDDEQTHSAQNIRTELVLSLVLIMAALAAYVALD
jgi:inner membrane protein YidH